MLRVEVMKGSARSRSSDLLQVLDVGGAQVHQGVGFAGDRVGADHLRVPLVARVIWAGVVRPVQNSSTKASVVQPTAFGSTTAVKPLITPIGAQPVNASFHRRCGQ